MPTSLAAALASGVVVLDGGLATELEAAGHDVSSTLWSARLLRDEPDAVVAAHRRFFDAGARVATTAGYQAHRSNLGEDADALLRRSVELAARAREEAELGGQAWVAASVGPYGAVLANGSEYTGVYDLDLTGLRAFHRPRLEVLAGAGADVLACETLPAAAEAEALLLELDDLGVPAWLSLTTVVDRHGVVRTRAGERAEDVFRQAGDVGAVVAVGVNCLDPRDVGPSVEAARAAGRPVAAYPNSGETWDAATRQWRGEAGLPDPRAWLEAGVRLVGGCCRVGPAAIAATAAATATWVIEERRAQPRPSSSGLAGSQVVPSAASRRRRAIADSASSTTRLASAAVMPAQS